MASTSAISMAMPLTSSYQKRVMTPSTSSFFNPLPMRSTKSVAAARPAARFAIKASLKEKAVTGLTAAALTASMVLPDAAEAASGVSPSLKNFLLSIAAGGIVLVAILGAVIGVSNFDPELEELFTFNSFTCVMCSNISTTLLYV